ncbi:hypothetical protein RvY_01738 [Ramazzottius varieornatus]|uniref:Uncharacterized protein n=1 Tax=Ramazzottius varieornatus TaxID=947166 RepID=A0A1D1UHF4_RAMVA|nr:hypothetical protein RvY_01738 [Ramazzottius varieornatus]
MKGGWADKMRGARRMKNESIDDLVIDGHGQERLARTFTSSAYEEKYEKETRGRRRKSLHS